ncbi:uncharacterized protein CTHT_0006090 [Thermochaetoides thermophila DSM 1495]|uniref:Myb-like DNA-binding domain-containing protein n=1 Tax=Chaetomium thermophilum (strain DSM 1495 / CBS 144.50 / IMI 039719) TaxID=759272 RepID=G0RYB4_CHATD|nr:hypothetical protein CTHT_0006090 [Thermochaetoides thermophila DSM 1495]EGS23900.1 hypothetical protein CTHT_0006090 [Thermochaetoides thermophila DSM 1495]
MPALKDNIKDSKMPGATEEHLVNFAAVAEELNIVSKAAAAKRYERLLKAHGINPASPRKNAATKTEEEGEPSTPSKKRKRATARNTTASKEDDEAQASKTPTKRGKKAAKEETAVKEESSDVKDEQDIKEESDSDANVKKESSEGLSTPPSSSSSQPHPPRPPQPQTPNPGLLTTMATPATPPPTPPKDEDRIILGERRVPVPTSTPVSGSSPAPCSSNFDFSEHIGSLLLIWLANTTLNISFSIITVRIKVAR